MIEIPQPQEFEIQPRLKVLVINCNPGMNPQWKIASGLFDTTGKGIEDFTNLAVTNIKSPSKDEEKSLFQRGKKSELFLPDNMDEYSAVVITGSPYVAFAREQEYSKIGDELATKEGKGAFVPFWKKRLIDFIKAANEKDKPVIGICFGAQLMAEALGGKVQDMPDEESLDTEKGWGRVYKRGGASNDPVFGDFPDSFVVPQNHQATITRLPEGGKVVLENEHGIQAFRIGNSWGLQFHPEKSAEAVEKIIAKREGKGINMDQVRSLGADYDAKLNASIFGNFLKVAWTNKQ